MTFAQTPAVRILGWFLRNPTKKIHFKELCRTLDISPLTVKQYCDEYVNEGWLKDEKLANLRFISLNNGDFAVRAMKRADALLLLKKAGITGIADNPVSLALYGSYASGEYDERSDVDILVVGMKEQVRKGEAERLGKAIGAEVQLTVFSLEKWENNKNKDAFMQSVLKNHVLLSGAPL